MSVKALFRTDVAFVETYSYLFEGNPVAWVTPIAWTKGNLQPYKQGIMTDLSNAGLVFTDWRVLYIKNKPELDYTNLPTNTDVQKGLTYFYYGGAWYAVTGDQDWRMQARGVKHYKLLAVKAKDTPDGLDANPTPVANLVDDFEQVVIELEQVNKTVKEVL